MMIDGLDSIERCSRSKFHVWVDPSACTVIITVVQHTVHWCLADVVEKRMDGIAKIRLVRWYAVESWRTSCQISSYPKRKQHQNIIHVARTLLYNDRITNLKVYNQTPQLSTNIRVVLRYPQLSAANNLCESRNHHAKSNLRKLASTTIWLRIGPRCSDFQ